MAHKPLTQRAHEHLRRALSPGCIAIDATVGNGHDTLFLARSAGTGGRVYGFDIQAIAIDNTQGLIDQNAALCGTVELFLAGHETMAAHLPYDMPGQVSAIVFNLGYLPGSDKTTITRPDTTIDALNSALQYLKHGGILSIMCYPGHPGGDMETATVIDWQSALDPATYICSSERGATPGAPILVLVERK